MRIKKTLAWALALSLTVSAQSCTNSIEKVENTPASGSVADTTDAQSGEQAGDDIISIITASDAVTTAATTTTETTTTTVTTTALPKGKLLDCKGNVLMYSEVDETGKEKRLTNDTNKVAFANVLNTLSEGLDLTFEKQLTEPNPDDVDGKKMGQSIQLTFDADIQNAVYSYMADCNIVGSAVVMRTDGSLAAQVNFPSYDPDLYEGVEHDDDLAWGYYGNKAFQNAEPGSCFKIMSEVISDKHGIYSVYDDGTWYYDGTSIVNWDHDTNFSYPMERSLYSAFINSSNIFFAKAFDQIGAEEVLSDLDTIFHFGTDIPCDFGNLHNNVEVYCNDDLRRTAFGQSYVLTCPIYMAALGREAVFGDMVTPFVIKNIVDTNDTTKVLKEGSAPNQVIASIPTDYRQNLLDGMSGVGANIGVYAPGGCSFYAKTGTAETWEGDFLYITGIVKRESDNGTSTWSDYSSYDGSYVIIMQIRNPGDHGFDFASESAYLYQGIVNTVMG